MASLVRTVSLNMQKKKLFNLLGQNGRHVTKIYYGLNLENLC